MGAQERAYSKSIGAYLAKEVDTKQQWLDGRTIYRKVIDCGAIPNATTKSIAHGISDHDRFTNVYGIADDGSTFLPLPWVHTTNAMIQLFVNATNVRIATGIDLSGYSQSYVTLEYVK